LHFRVVVLEMVMGAEYLVVARVGSVPLVVQRVIDPDESAFTVTV
jgi:hypothetical protein